MRPRSPLDNLPDVRDGLTRPERIVLVTLAELQEERRGRNVPTAMLYGRVVERIDMSVDELQRILQRLGAARGYGG
ncbi:hypothetical protein [Chondromyces apiculatus]|nr:hypothetical protein [Chondromyces apiculatus]